jgi:hypothetical protein
MSDKSHSVKQEPKVDSAHAGPHSYSVLRGVSGEGSRGVDDLASEPSLRSSAQSIQAQLTGHASR